MVPKKSTPRKPAPPPALPVIRLSPKARAALRALHATGLFGFSIEETAERFICDRIRDYLPVKLR